MSSGNLGPQAPRPQKTLAPSKSCSIPAEITMVQTTVRLAGRITPVCIPAGRIEEDDLLGLIFESAHSLERPTSHVRITTRAARCNMWMNGATALEYVPAQNGGMQSAADPEKLRRVQELLQRTLAATQTSLNLTRNLTRTHVVGVSQCSKGQVDASVERMTEAAAKSTARERFSEIEDDVELCRDLFTQIDKDENGFISPAEITSALEQYEGNEEMKAALQMALDRAQKKESRTVQQSLLESKSLTKTHKESASNPTAGEKGITFTEFSELLEKLPRVRGERVKWARALRLEEVVAKHLPKGDIFDGLKGLRELADSEQRALAETLASQVSTALPDLILEKLKALSRSDVAPSTEALRHINSKFCLDKAYIGRFATLDDFYQGPEALIGTPNPKIDLGMKTEHCHKKNSKEKFTTTNYNIETSPCLEWDFVVKPEEGVEYPHTPSDSSRWKPEQIWSEENPCGWKGSQGRDPITVEVFLDESEAVVAKLLAPLTAQRQDLVEWVKHARSEIKRAGLQRGEVIGLRLYTGPLFMLYNAVLRGFPAEDVAKLMGNRYETTIFSITSGITKLARISEVPPNRLLYRGLGGMILPRQFWDTYDECIVNLHISAGESVESALDAVMALLRKAEDEPPAGSARSKVFDISVKYLQLPTNNVPESLREVVASGIRVVKEPQAAGKAVAVSLALAVPKFRFEKELKEGFVKALGAACGWSITIVGVTAKAHCFRGGVEFGLMSTTTDKETAIAYSGVTNKRGTVFEIAASHIDLGASISFLSQYPAEEEFLMPPLSCLEHMYLSMIKYLCEELVIKLQSLRNNAKLERKCDEAIESFKSFCSTKTEIPETWFNNDEYFRGSLNEAVSSKMRSEALICLETQDNGAMWHSATLEQFFRGPEDLIGSPNPRIELGMESEHCRRENSKREFTTSNYNITTVPWLEWEFVVDPRDCVCYPHTPKERALWVADNCWKGDVGRKTIPLWKFIGISDELDTFTSNISQTQKSKWQWEFVEEMFNDLDTDQDDVISQGELEKAREKYKGQGAQEEMISWLIKQNSVKHGLTFTDCAKLLDNHEDERLKEARSMIQSAGLLRGEVIALRLLSGPMFDLYNAVLRGFPSKFVDCLFGNCYETTIFTASSGILKLSKVSKNIPTLYRGMRSLILPKQFWDEFDECCLTFFISTDIDNHKQVIERLKACIVEQRESGDVLGNHGTWKTESDQHYHKKTGYTILQFNDECKQKPQNCALWSDVRVALMPRNAGNSVEMSVILPISKFEFTPQLRNEFKERMLAICGCNHEIVITDIANKPRDFKGGIEMGFSSTTVLKRVAKYYAAVEGNGIVLEIQAGSLNSGAYLGIISQYPHEAEYVFPPLASLEVLIIMDHFMV